VLHSALGGLLVAAAGLPLWPLAAAVVRGIVPGRSVRFVRWGFSHVLGAALLGLALAWGSARVVPPAAAGEALDPLLESLRAILVEGALCALVARFAQRLDPDGARALGLSRRGNALPALAGLLAWLLCLPTLLALMQAWPAVLELCGAAVEEQPLLVALRALPPERFLPVAFLVVVVAPFLEELLFRSFLQPLLVQNLNEAAGIVVTSVLFALLHGSAAFLPIFALSLLLGGLMLRTRRLGACWLVHALNNGLALVAARALPPP
jgi:membrane protease YdiL (CAAX protease family)